MGSRANDPSTAAAARPKPPRRSKDRTLERWVADSNARRRAKAALWWSIALTLVLFLVPYGRFVAYPLMLLSTLVHEVGHGLAALAVGGTFERFVMFADGSGMAFVFGTPSGWPQAVVAAGGLVGPAIGAAIAFVAARRVGWSRAFLIAWSLALIALLALVVRNPFGIGFAAVLVVVFGGLGLRGSAGTAQVTTVFLAVQLALSVFSRGDYLFVETAHTGAGVAPSDVANMASALGGPYWAWGLACGAFSLVVLVVGAIAFMRALSPPKPLRAPKV